MITLTQLHADIEACVRAIRDDNHDWLCRLGCDGCCRRLAEVPRLTAGEWDWLRDGLASLPPEQLREIDQDIAALAELPSRPIVCPLLDRSAGGLYCNGIKSRVADGDWAGCGGNQDAMDRRLCGLGDTRDLTEWFASWKEAGGMA